MTISMYSNQHTFVFELITHLLGNNGWGFPTDLSLETMNKAIEHLKNLPEGEEIGAFEDIAPYLKEQKLDAATAFETDWVDDQTEEAWAAMACYSKGPLSSLD